MLQTSKNASASFLWPTVAVPITACGAVSSVAGSGPEGAPATPGLSLIHISPRGEIEPPEWGVDEGSYGFTWAKGANCARVIAPARDRRWRGGPRGVRGKIRGISRASRLNASEKIHEIDRSKVVESWFGTNTVPGGECSWLRMSALIDDWSQKLAEAFPGQFYLFWRKEPHGSGAPHLHFLIFWLRKPPKMKRFRFWNDNTWADLVKSPNPAHRRVGCRVEQMRSWEGVASYLASYLTKNAEFYSEECTGRMWGERNKKYKPVTIAGVVVPADVGRRTHRILRKLQQRKREKYLALLEGRWCRLRTSVVKSDSGCVLGVQTVPDKLAMLRRSGIKIKRVRPKCSVTLRVKVWSDVYEDDRHVGFERGQDEFDTRASSLYFVKSSEVERLVRFMMAEFRKAAPF